MEPAAQPDPTIPVRTITADHRMHIGPLAAVRWWWRHLWHGRHLIAQALHRDLRKQTDQTMLGHTWSIVMALLPVMAYTTLGLLGRVRQAEGMPYLLYVSCGVTVWLLLSGTITAIIKSPASDAALIGRSPTPVVPVMMSHFSSVLYDTGIRVLFIIGVAIVTGSVPSVWSALVLVLLPMVLVWAIAVGTICAFANLVWRDLQFVVDVILRYGLFVSAVLFPLPQVGLLEHAAWWNPFLLFVETIRSALFLGDVPHVAPLVAWSAFSLVLFIIGARLTYGMEERIREVLA